MDGVAQTFQIYGSHGSMTARLDTGEVIKYEADDGSTEYLDIVRFDVAEWRKFYVGQVLDEEDILCIGYWTKAGVYEPPCADFRGNTDPNSPANVAVRYAKLRWGWDDASAIEELVKDQDDVFDAIDEHADESGFDDPFENWFMSQSKIDQRCAEIEELRKLISKPTVKEIAP